MGYSPCENSALNIKMVIHYFQLSSCVCFDLDWFPVLMCKDKERCWLYMYTHVHQIKLNLQNHESHVKGCKVKGGYVHGLYSRSLAVFLKPRSVTSDVHCSGQFCRPFKKIFITFTVIINNFIFTGSLQKLIARFLVQFEPTCYLLIVLQYELINIMLHYNTNMYQLCYWEGLFNNRIFCVKLNKIKLVNILEIFEVRLK